MKLADRLSAVAPSATLALTQKAAQMRAAGRDVVALTAGEPDASPAPHILNAIEQALSAGFTRYTSVAGLPEVREAIAAHHSRPGRIVEPDEVVVSAGAKQTIFNAALATLDPGAEAVLLAPFWVSYPDIVRMCGGVPKIVDTRAEEGFAPDLDAFSAAFSERTRLFFLNSPSNPTGVVYDEETLQGIAEILRTHPDVLIVSDEIYDRFTFEDSRFVSILDVAPDLAPRTLIVNGCSKTYAMTGLRVGWGVGPRPLARALAKIQGQTTSNTSAPMQFAAKAALEGDQTWVDEMLLRFDVRRRYVLKQLDAMPGVECPSPMGAFYAFPNVSSLLSKRAPGGEPLDDVNGLCEYLINRYSLVVVPGAAFGAPTHLRLSYAVGMETLDRGLSRLAEAFASLE